MGMLSTQGLIPLPYLILQNLHYTCIIALSGRLCVCLSTQACVWEFVLNVDLKSIKTKKSCRSLFEDKETPQIMSKMYEALI